MEFLNTMPRKLSPRYARNATVHQRSPSTELPPPDTTIPLTVKALHKYLGSRTPTPEPDAGRGSRHGDGRRLKAERELDVESDEETDKSRTLRFVEEFLEGATKRDEKEEPCPEVMEADRNRLESQLRFETRDNLRALYLDAHDELIGALDELLMLESKVADLDDDLALLETKLEGKDESIEVLQLQLNAADDYGEALLQEKTEALRKLSEAKSELALLSTRYAKMQQDQMRDTGKEMTSGSSAGESNRTSINTVRYTIRSLQGQSADNAPEPAVETLAALERSRKEAESAKLEMERLMRSCAEARAAAEEAQLKQSAAEQMAAQLKGELETATQFAEKAEEARAAAAEAQALAEDKARAAEEALSQENAKKATGMPTDVQLSVALRRLDRAKDEINRLQRDLKAQRAKSEELAGTEQKLLADISQLSRQLRLKESAERDSRFHRPERESTSAARTGSLGASVGGDSGARGATSRVLNMSGSGNLSATAPPSSSVVSQPPPPITAAAANTAVDAARRRREIIQKALEEARRRKDAVREQSHDSMLRDHADMPRATTLSPSPPRNAGGRRVSTVIHVDDLGGSQPASGLRKSVSSTHDNSPSNLSSSYPSCAQPANALLPSQQPPSRITVRSKRLSLGDVSPRNSPNARTSGGHPNSTHISSNSLNNTYAGSPTRAMHSDTTRRIPAVASKRGSQQHVLASTATPVPRRSSRGTPSAANVVHSPRTSGQGLPS